MSSNLVDYKQDVITATFVNFFLLQEHFGCYHRTPTYVGLMRTRSSQSLKRGSNIYNRVRINNDYVFCRHFDFKAGKTQVELKNIHGGWHLKLNRIHRITAIEPWWEVLYITVGHKMSAPSFQQKLLKQDILGKCKHKGWFAKLNLVILGYD